MAETKRTLRIFGHDVKVSEVPIKSAMEFFNEYELEDGSIIKVKFVATAFQRVEGEYGPDGRPIYIVFSAPAPNVISSPAALMRPPQQQQQQKPN